MRTANVPSKPTPPRPSSRTVVLWISLVALGFVLICYSAGGDGGIRQPLPIACGVLVASAFALIVRRFPFEPRVRRHLSLWLAFSAGVQGLILLPSIVRHTPRLWNPLEQVVRDHKLAERGRRTVCRQLDVDPTRFPFRRDELGPEHQPKITAYVDRVSAQLAARGSSATPTGALIQTPPMLIERLPASDHHPAEVRLYRLDPTDLEGLAIFETMLVAERECPAEPVAGMPQRPLGS